MAGTAKDPRVDLHVRVMPSALIVLRKSAGAKGQNLSTRVRELLAAGAACEARDCAGWAKARLDLLLAAEAPAQRRPPHQDDEGFPPAPGDDPWAAA